MLPCTKTKGDYKTLTTRLTVFGEEEKGKHLVMMALSSMCAKSEGIQVFTYDLEALLLP
jgi:hypothetical protein